MKTRTHRLPLEKAEDIAIVAGMRLRRVQFTEIQTFLNSRPGRGYTLSRGQCHADYRAAEQIWKDDAKEAIERERAEMLAEANEVRKEAWRIYEESRKDKTIKRAEKSSGGGASPDGTKQIVTVHQQTGDPNALRLVLEAQERRAKILGLDAPTKTELTGAGGTPIGIGAPSMTIIVTGGQTEKPWHEQVLEATGKRIEPLAPELEG